MTLLALSLFGAAGRAPGLLTAPTAEGVDTRVTHTPAHRPKVEAGRTDEGTIRAADRLAIPEPGGARTRGPAVAGTDSGAVPAPAGPCTDRLLTASTADGVDDRATRNRAVRLAAPRCGPPPALATHRPDHLAPAGMGSTR